MKINIKNEKSLKNARIHLCVEINEQQFNLFMYSDSTMYLTSDNGVFCEYYLIAKKIIHISNFKIIIFDEFVNTFMRIYKSIYGL